MGWSHGSRWTPELIYDALAEYVARLGRMPSTGEMRATGQNQLAQAIKRNGGVRVWAAKFGVEQKGSETHRGQRWERHEAAFFSSAGFTVASQTVKAPFDLLVNDRRIDVKCSILNRTGWFQFGNVRQCVDCDFLDLICVSSDGSLLGRFIVPAVHANVATISMMPATLAGKGKYAPFRDRIEQLR